MAITPLSEASCACGGAPQAIPDFTNGRFLHREAAPKSIYSLTEMHDDLFEQEIHW